MMSGIEITAEITLPEKELQFSFVRGAGPGGQNKNALATTAQLRFDLRGSPSLPEPLRRRALKLAGRRVSHEGILVIEAKNHRTQSLNKSDAIQRLVELLQKAAKPPKPRRKTKPSKAAKEKRVTEKKQRSEIKQQRRSPGHDIT